MTGRLSRRGVLILAGGAFALTAWARRAFPHSYAAHALFIGHIWSPPGSGPDFPVYGPILNRGTEPDALVGARSPWAKSVELAQAGADEPATLDEIALPPGKPVTLAPWTVHLVLSGLTRPVKPGDRIPITLSFRNAGVVAIESLVQSQPGE